VLQELFNIVGETLFTVWYQNFTNCLYKNGSYVFLPKDQRRVFVDYYEDLRKLSKPSNDHYDNSYLALCNIRQQFVDDEMKAAQPVEFFQEQKYIWTIFVKTVGKILVSYGK
jgi:hypothetical protein